MLGTRVALMHSRNNPAWDIQRCSHDNRRSCSAGYHDAPSGLMHYATVVSALHSVYIHSKKGVMIMI